MISMAESYLGSNIFDRAPKNSLKQSLVQFYVLSGIYPFFRSSLNTFYVPEAVVDIGDTVVDKTCTISALIQFAVSLPPSRLHRSVLLVSKIQLKSK